MATKKLRKLHIKIPHFTFDHNYEVEDVLELRWFNGLDSNGKVVSTTTDDRLKLAEDIKHRSTLLNRYLDNISQLSFISQARMDKYPSYYAEICTTECINNGVKGYAVTPLEAVMAHSEIILDDAGVGYMIEYIKPGEAVAVAMVAEMYHELLSYGMNQREFAPIRAEMQQNLQDLGLSLRRSKLLTRHLIQEHI